MAYSYSQLSVLQECERRWALRYREGLRRAGDTPWALLRGKAWHAVMAAEAQAWGLECGTLIHEPQEIQVLDEMQPLSSNSRVDAVVYELSEWERSQGQQFLDVMTEEYGDRLSARIWNLWLRFSQGRSKTELFGSPLAVEQTWTRAMPNGLELTGITDLVFADSETDQIVVRDWKLHESWPTTPPAIEDLVNSQLHVNAWGIAPLLREAGYTPECVEYARARFKKPATPTLTKATAKAPSRLAKTTTDYDAYTYAEFCASPVAVEAGYQMDEELYNKLTEERDRWFRIQRKPLLYNVFSQHVLSAQSQAERAESITTDGSVASYGSHCARCEFSSLCRADLMGGRQAYDEINPMDYDLRRKSVQ